MSRGIFYTSVVPVNIIICVEKKNKPVRTLSGH